MSVANQANEKLTQLVTLTAKIESYLNPSKKGKGKGEAEAKTEKGGGNSKNISQEAAAVGGMAQSLAAFFKEYKKAKMGDGEQVKKLLINLSDGIKEAAKSLEEVDSEKLLNTIQTVMKGVAGFTLTMVLVGLAAPLFAVGILVFSLGVSAMNLIFKYLGKDTSGTEAALNVLNMFGKGAALFTLTMVLISLVASQFAMGVIVFTLAVSAMMWIFNKLGQDTKNTESALEMLNKMSSGAALFALTMILVGLTAPLFAKGVIVFTLATGAMILAFSLLGSTKVKKSVTDSLKLLFDLSIGAAMFALTMILIGLAYKPFAKGVMVFTLAVAGLMIVFRQLGGMKKGIKDSLQLLMSMSLDIALFALVMTLIGLVAPTFLIGVGSFVLGLSAIMTVLGLAGKFSKEINKGVKVLTEIVKPIAMISVVFVLLGLVSPLFLIGVGSFVLGLAVLSTVLGLVGKFDKEIRKGIKVTGEMAKPIGIFSGVLFLVGLVAEQVFFGSLAAAGAMLVLGLASYVLGKFDKEIKKGVGALTALTPALILFSVGMFILAAAPDSPLNLALKMAVVAGAIVVLGLAAYVLGQPAVFPFVLLGAAALVVLSAPLILFAGALFLLSLAKFTTESVVNLGLAIGVIGVSLAGMGFIAPLVLIGAAVMAVASVALLPLTASLAIFKSIGWQESDGESLKNALSSTIQAFAHALDGVGLTGMFKLLAAIPIVGMLGTALSSLALGIKAMATMTFTEMEWDEKAGKLVPKRQVRLTDTEIQQVGPNVAAILSALAKPLTTFGVWASQGSSDGFFGIGGSSGYMEKGIEAAAKVGRIIGSLAKGVSDMANLNVVEWQVVNGELKPASVRKLNPLDFLLAGINTGFILDTIAAPLVRFGESASKGEGLFSSGYLLKGVEAAKGVGDIVASLAKGVSDMANLTVVEYVVKDGKLVPSKVRKLRGTDFIKAGLNVGKILSALTKPLTDFGRDSDKGSGLFSGGYMEKGIKTISTMTDPIAKLAKMVSELAAGRAVINEVKDGKIVPVGTVSFADAVPKAADAVRSLLTGKDSLPSALVAFGKFYEENEDPINLAIEGLDYVFKLVKKVADFGNLYNTRKADMEGAGSLSLDFLPKFLLGSLLPTNGLSFALRNFGTFYEKNEDSLKASTDGLEVILSNMKRIANIGAFFNAKVIDISSSGVAAKVLIPITKDLLEVVRNYNAMQKLIKEAQDSGLFSLFKRNLGIEDVFKDITKGIEALNPGLGQLDSAKISTFSNLTHVIERLARASSPFQRFTKAFGVFSRDMGIFVKNWKQFTTTDANNFKIYGDVTDKISKVDVGKLKGALDALVKYEKEKLVVEKERATIVKDIMAGAGEDPTKVMEKLSNLLEQLTGSGDAGGKEGGKGGPINTPTIKVSGNIIVNGKPLSA